MTATEATRYARIAGLLLLISLVAGGFGEGYAPSRLIVSNDAAATAKNLIESDTLFRVGFAAYLIEAVCDIILSLLFYVLLKPVHKPLALLSAFFGLVSTSVFACAELFYFAAPLVLRNATYLTAFPVSERNALALLSLKLYGLGGTAFLCFYGIATLIRGVLIFRSQYLPKIPGVLFAIAGAGFIARNFALVLAPAVPSDILLLPMLIAGVWLIFSLMVKGVDAAAWPVAEQR